MQTLRPPIARRSLLLSAPALLAARIATGAEGPLRFGLTPVFLNNEAAVIDALTLALADASGRPVLPVQRRSYAEVTALLLEGAIEAAWLCGFPWLRHRDRLGPVATPIWQGRPLYRAYVIAANDDPARELSDLHGGVHAFSDPDSNSGWLVTVSDLARMGARPDAFFRRTIFTWGHRNVVRAVASGLSRSGSVDGYVYDVLAAVEPELTQATQVIARSEWVGFPPVVARRGDPVAGLLRAALLGLAGTAPGRAALGLLRLDGFAAPDERDFAPIAGRMAMLG